MRLLPTTILSILAILAVPGRVSAQDVSNFSDEKVQQAIERAKDWLWDQQEADGSWGEISTHRPFPTGWTAIITFALLESGENPQHPQMEKALEWLRENRAEMTYSLGLRCNAWELANRLTGGKYHDMLRYETQQLIESQDEGRYGYIARGEGQQDSFCNSNTQYGNYGVWAGVMGGVEVPAEYWRTVEKHWREYQNEDGGWAYRTGSSSATMTAAGIASLFVVTDNIYLERFVRPGAGGRSRVIDDAIAWMENEFANTLNVGFRTGHGGCIYYHLFGIERIGLAAGIKYLDGIDWYKAGASLLVQNQRNDGSWSGRRGTKVSTAYALLFLSRGQKPVLWNKLEYDGDWHNRPRDLAGLCEWMTRTFETDVYWQIVNFDTPVTEWHDAPVLHISGARAPQFTDEQIARLRDYVNQGGVIFSTTEGGSRPFTDGIRRVYQRMFPEYRLLPARPDHELTSIHFRLGSRPRFHVISNGVRPLVIHADEDLPVAWHMRRSASHRWAFEGAANVAMYITDMGSFRHRGTTHWPDEPGRFSPRGRATLARISFDGNHDPEPLAYRRFAMMMANEHRVRVDVTDPIPATQLAESDADVATLTGTGRFELSNEEAEALQQWVADGGTLVIDAAGGDAEFAESAEQLLAGLYGRRAMRRLSPRSDILRLSGKEIDTVSYRRKARVRLGGADQPNLRTVMVDGRPAIIFSPEDITGGLVGVPSYTIDGYSPESAWEIMRNIVFWATGG